MVLVVKLFFQEKMIVRHTNTVHRNLVINEQKLSKEREKNTFQV